MGLKRWQHPEPSAPAADRVYTQLLADYPDKALRWVHDRDIRWEGPVPVDTHRIDFCHEEAWKAHHERGKVARFERKIRRQRATGQPVKPIILVQTPDNDRMIVIDGHHRSLANRHMGTPVESYIAHVPTETGSWLQTHVYQYTDDTPGASEFSATAAKAASPASAGIGGVNGVPGLTPSSGMISLDLPDGLIPLPDGGVGNPHITLVYLGPDVGEELRDTAFTRVRALSQDTSPFTVTLRGIETFPPSGSSGGKVPVYIPASAPQLTALRDALADLSASEHTVFRPHVTVRYADPGDPLPDPYPPVTFTARDLSVHRGPEVTRFPLSGPDRTPELEQWSAEAGLPRDTARKVTAALHKAGNTAALISWYNSGAGGGISWGSHGDFDSCVRIASQYVSDPEGFCAERHHDVTGQWPGPRVHK